MTPHVLAEALNIAAIASPIIRASAASASRSHLVEMRRSSASVPTSTPTTIRQSLRRALCRRSRRPEPPGGFPYRAEYYAGAAASPSLPHQAALRALRNVTKSISFGQRSSRAASLSALPKQSQQTLQL